MEKEGNEALRNARLVRKWSQAKLAQRAGINRTTYVLIENGKIPELRTAYKLADALGERVDELFLPTYVI
jgi:DNA-binding XRE family transcriptional regulator